MTRRQKKRMALFTGIVLGSFCLGILIGAVCAQNQKEPQESIQTIAEIRENTIPKVLEEKTAEVLEKQAENLEEETEENLPDDWNLILVNQTHLVPEDYQHEKASYCPACGYRTDGCGERLCRSALR